MTGTQDTTVVTRFYDQVDCLRVRRLTGPTVNVVGGSHGQKITDRGYVLRTYGGVGGVSGRPLPLYRSLSPGFPMVRKAADRKGGGLIE